MVFLEYFLDPVGSYFRVDLSSRDIRVPEHLLDRPQIRASLKEVGRETMAYGMGRKRNTQTPTQRLDSLPEPLSRHASAHPRHEEIWRLSLPEYRRSFFIEI